MNAMCPASYTLPIGKDRGLTNHLKMPANQQSYPKACMH